MTVPLRSPRFAAGDWFCLAVLALAAVVLRFASLEVRVMNVDESQYEARAAYLLATDQAVFEVPHGAVFTSWLFATLARWFGPYCMWHARVMVLVINVAISWLIFLAVRREAGRWWGLLGGATLLAVNPLYGGLSVNREWYSVLAVLLGWWLYGASANRSSRAALAFVWTAGAANGVGVWFKFQALPLTLAIVPAILLEAAARRAWRQGLSELLAYCLGGAAACAVYLAGFAWYGTLGEHLAFVTDFKLAYAHPDESAAGPPLMRLLRHALLETRAGGVLAVAYATAAACLLAACLRASGKSPAAPAAISSRSGLLYACGLASSLVAVQLGGRYFEHYFLYLLPAAAVLFALGLASVTTWSRWQWGLSAAFLVLIAAALAGSGGPPNFGWSAPARTLVQAAIVAAALATFVVLLGRLPPLGPRPSGDPLEQATPPRPRSPAALAAGPAMVAAVVALLALEAVGIANYQWYALADLRTRHAEFDALMGRVPNLAARLRLLAQPGERLFVWGWRPEIYSLGRLEPATRYVICQYLADDSGSSSPASAAYSARQRQRLLEELEARRPAFFCDAQGNAPGGTLGENYSLDRFGELRDFLHAHYRFVERVDDVDLWVDRSRPPSAD